MNGIPANFAVHHATVIEILYQRPHFSHDLTLHLFFLSFGFFPYLACFLSCFILFLFVFNKLLHCQALLDIIAPHIINTRLFLFSYLLTAPDLFFLETWKRFCEWIRSNWMLIRTKSNGVFFSVVDGYVQKYYLPSASHYLFTCNGANSTRPALQKDIPNTRSVEAPSGSNRALPIWA